MAAKVAILIAGLFVLALLQFAPGALQEIPDDKVYTELKKTLIHGSSGILTCRFTGPPFDVYWKKGHDGWASPTVVRWTSSILRTLTPGAKTGPRYEDGSCDMTENYSVVIKTVNYTDAGRYLCFVSNQHGILIDNYTDVTVTDVGLETEPKMSLQKGLAGILPCKLNVRPKVVTWKKGQTYSSAKTILSIDKYHNVGKISGPGYEEGMFDITADYSLVIVYVENEDEGQYFCDLLEVDTNNTFQDFTYVTVFARPIKPFPAIEGCSTTEDHSNCIFTVKSSVTLTCHANKYYPDIGLYFQHGSKEVAALHTQTWNNTDGTKNKSVTIVGDISHELYRCVAFEIPGVDGNRSTSVRLIRQNESPYLFAFIVPFVLITIGLLTWILLRRCGKDRSQEDRPAYMEDLVTYVELWKLVEYASQHKEIDFLGDAIAVLCSDGNENPREITDKKDYYDGLCRWKGTCEERIQRTTLYETLHKNGLGKSLANLKDFRGTVSTEIRKYDLEHILREIGEQDEITKFLLSLKINPTERPREGRKSSTTFHQQALGKLITWTTGNRDINPLVSLSSTLEKLNHKSANNFFLIPKAAKLVFADSEYKRYARDVSINHGKKLTTIIQSSHNSVIVVKKALDENSETLFNIERMLRDWWKEQECSYYKRRCTLTATLHEVQQKHPEDTEHTADDQWPTNEELKLIANCIDQKFATRVSKHLGVSDLPETADEQKRFEALCAWRHSNKGEGTKMHGDLVSALKSTNISGLLSPLRNNAVHKAEVVDIAFNLLMTDILPLARLLGVCEAKLSTYRPVFEPSHLTQGTIGLVSTLVSLLDKKNREKTCGRSSEKGDFHPPFKGKSLPTKFPMGKCPPLPMQSLDLTPNLRRAPKPHMMGVKEMKEIPC